MSVGAEIILMFWDIDHNCYAVKQPFNFGVFTMCVDQGAIPDIGFDFVFFFLFYLCLYSPYMYMDTHIRFDSIKHS